MRRLNLSLILPGKPQVHLLFSIAYGTSGVKVLAARAGAVFPLHRAKTARDGDPDFGAIFDFVNVTVSHGRAVELGA